MSADARLKSFIDRILRLKEEQDTLATDIREVYAEAKGDGYNKTAMGEVVAHLRKIEKKGKDAVAEKQADFDLYLEAYERASGTAGDVPHAYAREAKARIEIIDSETGEIHDTQEQSETAIEMDRAEVSGNSGQLVAAEKGSEAIPAEPEGADLSHAGADESSAADGQDVEATVEQRPSATNHQSTGVLPAGGSSPSASEIDEIAEPAQPSPPMQAEPETAGEGVPSLSPAILSDEEVVPAFMKGKPGCLKLRDGHCKIGFATEALCAECADKRAKAMA